MYRRHTCFRYFFRHFFFLQMLQETLFGLNTAGREIHIVKKIGTAR